MTIEQIATKEDIAELSKQVSQLTNAVLQNVTPRKEVIYTDRKGVCKLLSISLSTVDKYIKEGIIPSYKIGGNVRFKKCEIEESLTNIHQLNYQRSGN